MFHMIILCPILLLRGQRGYAITSIHLFVGLSVCLLLFCLQNNLKSNGSIFMKLGRMTDNDMTLSLDRKISSFKHILPLTSNCDGYWQSPRNNRKAVEYDYTLESCSASVRNGSFNAVFFKFQHNTRSRLIVFTERQI